MTSNLNLTKTQKEHLLGVAIGPVAVCAALYFLPFGVQDSYGDLAATVKNTQKMNDDLAKERAAVKMAPDIGLSYTNKLALLQDRESHLAPDPRESDAYAWIINTINPFIATRRGISISSFSQPDVTDVGMIPKFPYRWATFHLKGAGYYHDFGRFFADFENDFPYFRIQNVDINPNPGPGYDAEKLGFTFDIVAPVVSSSDTK